jgi:PAS domain S-box-containing protein
MTRERAPSDVAGGASVLPTSGIPGAAGASPWRPSRWFPASALLVLAALALWVALVLAPRERSEVIARWRDQVAALVEDRAGAVERWAAERFGDVSVVAAFPSVASLLGETEGGGAPRPGGEVRAHLDQIIGLVTVHYGYLSGVVLATDGRAVAGFGADLEPDPASRELVRECVTTGRRAAAFALRRGTRPVVYFVAPVVRHASTQVIGAVLLAADPESWLYPFLKREPVLTSTAETLLVIREGDQALFLTPLRHNPAAPLTLRRPLSAAGGAAAATLAGRSELGDYLDYRGVRVLAAARRIGGTPWALVAKVDRDEAFAEYHRWQVGALAGLAVALIAIGGLGFGLWHRDRALVREAAAVSERRLAELVNEADNAVFVLSAEGKVLQANPRAAEMYGYPLAELVGTRAADLHAPEAREGALAASRDALGGGPVRVETVHRHRDGTTFPVEVSTHHAVVGGERFLLQAVRDITDQEVARERIRFLNRLLRTISEINQLIVRERDRDRLLHEACRILVEHGEFLMAWVGLAGEASGVVTPVASAGLEDGYLGLVTIRFDDTPHGRGPTGTAIREGRPVVANDWAADGRLAPWREAARPRGYRSSAAFPLSVGGEVIGALTVYMGVATAFDAEVTALLTELTGDLSFALEAMEAAAQKIAADDALRESELQFRTLAETTGLGIMIVQDERFIYANPATERMVGYTAAELAGMRFYDLLHPDYRELVRQRASARLAGARDLPTRYEIKGIAKGGVPRWFELTSGATLLGGRPALVASIADVTEERRLRDLQAAIYEISEATQATSGLDELFRSIHAIVGRLMEARNFYIALYDPATNLLSFPYFVDEVDEPPAPFPAERGMTSHVVHTGQALLATPEVMKELEEKGEIQPLGADSVDWLGVPLKVQDVVIGVLAVQSYSGKVRYSAADQEVLSYVSAQVAQALEHKRAEDELRSSEARFRSYFELPLHGFAISSTEKRWLQVNDRLCSILGYSREELLRLTWPEITHPEDVEANLRWFDRLRAGEVDRYELEKRFIRKDGGVVWTRLSAGCVRKPDGALDYLVVLVEDISQRKAAEAALEHSRAQLRQAQKMEAVGNLAGGVAHDFNNLLQALLSQAQLLRTYAHDPERVKALGLELAQQISHGASLTRQLLLFSRRETTRREPFDLNHAVRDATKMLRRLVRANIALDIELADEALTVTADRGQFEQVLMNLTVNASDAMPEGGRLTIRTGALAGRRVWLSVEDTGTGIPDAIRERIFEPFFTTKGAGKGTGLGLSVVHGIVSQHGGSIEVDSEPGRGTRFRVILPAAAPAELSAAAEDAAEVAELQVGKGERILVVEDEEAAREGLRDILQSVGYEVTAAASGEEVGTLPADQPFDVLLTDLMLPGISGWDLAENLQERWPSLRVILMSGYAEDEAVRRGIGKGNMRFLQKPFDMAHLAREIRHALTQPPGFERSA